MAKKPTSSTGRNLVICCDGTANEFKKDRTNVLKLAFAAVKDSDTQLLYYHPGVGTMAPPGLFSGLGKAIARGAGMAFGYGLKADIRDVYTFIIEHYRPGDRVFIFGFSRGAYTARAVVALLHAYGLLGPGNAALVPYAIRLLWNYDRARNDDERNACFRLAGEFKQALSIGECHPHFLGLWDTVSSVGWIANPLSLPYTRRLPKVAKIRHAVAIDERRAFFRTNLVELDPKRDIKQIWFPGVHCDVGGGYPEAESGLSKIPLKWMIDEASEARMLFDPERVRRILGETAGPYVPPDPKAKMHNSLLPFWWLAESIPKRHWDQSTGKWGWRANLFRWRRFRESPVIDASAWARGDDYVHRLPKDAIKLSGATLADRNA